MNNDYINNAIKELVNSLGVKEEAPYYEISQLIQNGDIKQSIKKIAGSLGLPIEIIVQYVPAGYRPDNNVKFNSQDLSRTDSSGHGIESITAQVSIPGNLPLYGTSSLTGFPINVIVSENCREEPSTFIAIMSHELAHILLASIRHPKKNNELYTDLTPMILGFSKIIEKGRKQSTSTTSGDTTTTNTVTYGYLTDNQFVFASGMINNILSEYRQRKERLLKSIAKTKKQFFKSKRNLFLFNKFIKYLSENQKETVKKQDSVKIVSFYSLGYTDEVESILNEVKRFFKETESFVVGITNYTNLVLQKLQDISKKQESISNKLGHASHQLHADLKILRRNVNFIQRIRIWLLCNSDKTLKEK